MKTGILIGFAIGVIATVILIMMKSHTMEETLIVGIVYTLSNVMVGGVVGFINANKR